MVRTKAAQRNKPFLSIRLLGMGTDAVPVLNRQERRDIGEIGRPAGRGKPLLVQAPQERKDQQDHDQREHGSAVQHEHLLSG